MPLAKIQQTALDTTKISYTNHIKSTISILDMNKILRREQTYRKKLKGLIEDNTILEAQIKINQSAVKDERSTILYQLNELRKTMNSKVSTYVDEKLDKDKFKSNEQAVETIKQMIQKFQVVEKQANATKKVCESLNQIFERYKQYSEDINLLVKKAEKSNKEYEDGMKNMLCGKQNQIVNTRQNNEDIYDRTQSTIKKIDQYEAERLKLIQEEAQLQQQIQNLNQIEQEARSEVDRFTKWVQIVIDKNHRKVFNKESTQKEAELLQIKSSNKRLEIFYKELQNEEQFLLNLLKQKQNQMVMDKSKYLKSKMNKSWNLKKNSRNIN